jgi:hypothetical protein
MVAYAVLVDPLGHGTVLGFILTGIQVAIAAAVYLGALTYIDPRRRADLRGLRRRLRRSTDTG